MIDFLLVALSVGVCLLGMAWYDMRMGNRRDGTISTFFGLFTVFRGMGLTVSS